jgi:hypothetical protein
MVIEHLSSMRLQSNPEIEPFTNSLASEDGDMVCRQIVYE